MTFHCISLIHVLYDLSWTPCFTMCDCRYYCIKFPDFSYLLSCACMTEPHHYDLVHICLYVHAIWLHFIY